MSPTCGSQVVSIDEVPVDESAELLADRPVIMVVDDEPLVADTLAMILRHAGYQAVRAYDAKTALEMASVRAPDLLITDVAMPEMNGVELALGMVTLAPQCKVVLFSGHARSVDLMRAYDAGHDFPLMAKPMHPKDMLGQVAKSLQAGTMRIGAEPSGLQAAVA
jgi:DNA-binding NtrC family response regulator